MRFTLWQADGRSRHRGSPRNLCNSHPSDRVSVCRAENRGFAVRHERKSSMAATSLTLSSSLPPPTLADARGAAALVAGCAEPATAKRLKALCSDESTWSDVTGDSLRGAAAVSQMMLAALDSFMPAAVRVDLLDCVTWYVAWTAKAGKVARDGCVAKLPRTALTTGHST